MKYIRTKNGVYKLDSRYNQVIEKGNKKYYINCNYENEILNQADTIEELCDVFYIESNADILPSEVATFPVAKKKLENLKEFIGTKEKHAKWCDILYREKPDFVLERNIYGAIFIKGKGLIYVAKMNSEGELELL